MMFPLRRVAILGVGMMGGSLGKALLKRDLAVEVIGYDADPAAVQLARQVGAVTHAAATAAEAVVRISSPGSTGAGSLPAVAGNGAYLVRCLVTDLCSTKAAVTKAEEALLYRSLVGGHPMAGSEKQAFWLLKPIF